VNEERHWSQHEPTQETARLRRTIFVQLILPAFGRAVVICECGARADIAPEPTANLRGRPRHQTTPREAAEAWAAAHVEQTHASCDEWELRVKHMMRPPPQGDPK
jgi:hypothetical protein